MKYRKITFYIVTGLLSLMMLGAAGNYIINHEEIAGKWILLGFPTWTIYPMATAKILAVIAIVSNLHKTLKEWAYAGLFFNFALAIGAHMAAADNEYLGAVVAMIFLLVSYFTDDRVAGSFKF